MDTHVLLWLHARETFRLSGRVAGLLEHVEIAIPALVWLELHMMDQKNRLAGGIAGVQAFVNATLPLLCLSADIADVCRAAQGITWTRDPFDRLIVAESIVHDIPLITKDRHIRSHYPNAIW